MSVKKFAAEYQELCNKYGYHIVSCDGCYDARIELLSEDQEFEFEVDEDVIYLGAQPF